MTLQSELIFQALKIGKAKVEELREPSSLAIVDPGGNLAAFIRTENAGFGAAEVAINKAYTPSAFKIRTADIYVDAQPGEEIYGFQNTNYRPFVVFGGGVPVFVGGQLACSVGVSGGPIDADVAIAGWMINALETTSQEQRYLSEHSALI